MDALTTSLILNLQNNQFMRGLRQSGHGVNAFTNKSERELRSLRQEFKQLTGGVLGNFRNEIVAIGAAWSGLQIAKESALLDKNLTRMSQTAGVARSETKELRKELYELQKQYGVTVDSSRRSGENLLQSGLDWTQALKANQAIAPATAVTGADSNVLASGLSVGSKIFGFDLAQVGVATDLLDKMTVAGRAGNAELEDLSSIFSRVGVNAKSANLDFDQTLGFIEQLSLFEKQPERLATIADSTLRIFTNLKYQDKVSQRLGINFYGKDGNRRDTFSVIDDIAQLYQKQKNDQQRDALIGAAFGETDLDTQRGIKAFLSGDSVAGAKAITEQIRNATGTIDRDLKDALDNGVDQTARLRGALGQAADSFAQPINNTISNLIKYTLDNKDQGGLGLDGADLMLGGAGALIGAGALYKYGGRAAKSFFGKGGALVGGVAAGKALEEVAGVTPVYVVNMPGGMGSMPGMPGGIPGISGTAGKVHTTVSKAMATAGMVGGTKISKLPWLGAGAMGWAGLGLTAAGGAGYLAGDQIYEHGLKGTDLSDDIGRAIAKTLAFFGNDSAQSALDAEQKALAHLKVEVDDNRVTVRSVEATGMEVDAYEGGSMVAP
ncbi:MAG: phage tail tape measure protein [Neptuniibacter sp.]